MDYHPTPQIEHDLHPHFPHLSLFNSTTSLEKSPLYQELKPRLLKVLNGYEIINTVPTPAAKPHYRTVAWNVERGIRYDEILYFLKNHPVLSKADVLLLTETDLGMARSKNRNIARDLAEALGMNYFFAPSYLNLEKGNGAERSFEGENELGIHGNAILSRYPIHKPRLVSIPNTHDKMHGKEKRLGNQRALIATIDLPGHPLRVGCFHVNVRSTQEQRKSEVERVVKAINEEGATQALIGGDWNTSTYDSHRALSAIIGFWIRTFMGTHNMIRNHYPYPERFFEKKLFAMLEKSGFDYKSCNEIGGATTHYRVDDLKQASNLRDWIPGWCFRFIEWALKEHDGKCSFKLDWFAQKNLKVFEPKVIGNLYHNGIEASDHDAISVDFSF